ncbi:MAG: hypothetical protein C0501_03515 [Isosphaera sp.]|nr:hypothetical protein [Isosphaera sp.]
MPLPRVERAAGGAELVERPQLPPRRPAVPLERGLRSRLAEVRAEEVAGSASPADRVEGLAGREAELDRLVALWAAKMDDPAIADLVAAKLVEFQGKLAAVTADLDAARLEAATPAGEAWGEFRSLAGTDPAADTDEARVRMRAARRRAVASVHCLFAGRGRVRLAAVQVNFRAGGVRK